MPIFTIYTSHSSLLSKVSARGPQTENRFRGAQHPTNRDRPLWRWFRTWAEYHGCKWSFFRSIYVPGNVFQFSCAGGSLDFILVHRYLDQVTLMERTHSSAPRGKTGGWWRAEVAHSWMQLPVLKVRFSVSLVNNMLTYSTVNVVCLKLWPCVILFAFSRYIETSFAQHVSGLPTRYLPPGSIKMLWHEFALGCSTIS